MKTLLKLFLALIVLFVILIGVGFFVLTRPGVQKKLVEGQLPEGSSIRTVRVTTSSLELSELKLALPDGTMVRLEMLETDFKPLAAIFDQTIKLGALKVDGLVVEIPQTLIQSPSKPTPLPDLPGTPSKPSQTDMPAKPPADVASQEAPGSPTDIFYAAGQIEWLFDIDSIQLEGELRDGAGSRYAIDMKSGAIRPGQEATMDASLKLNSREALHAGLKNFDASTRLFLKQNIDGGFEEIRLESLTKASDASGNNLLTVNQDLKLAVQGFDEIASLELTFNADLPKPEIFLPEMAGVGPVNVQGALSAGAKGSELTLSETDLLVSLAGSELAAVKLNKQFTIGGNQDLSGNLMDVRITNLPFSLLMPWMPEGVLLSGAPISAQLNVTGLPGGALQLSSLAPLRIGPMSLSQDGQPLLNQVTVLAQPVIQMAADQTISWTLNDFQIQDSYGAMLSGQSTGRFNPAASAGGFLPAGLQTQTKLDIGLQEITQQPALAGYASILSGRTVLDLKLSPSEKYPLQVQGTIDAISPRAYPGQRQDYRFALQVNEPSSGLLTIGANLQAGSEARPTSSLQFAGQVRPEDAPLKFKLDLTAPRLSQGDFEMLRAAFEPNAPQASPVTPTPGVVSPPTPSTPRPPSPSIGMPEASAPLWAGYDGELNIKVGELYLLSGMVFTDVVAQAVVTEPQLSLKQAEAKYQGGKLSGKAEARYFKGQRMAYAVQTDLNFENLDPAMFTKNRSDRFPVRGQFDGEAKLAAKGATLDEAIEAIEGEILLTGREGVLTAFELDNRSNLGLIGAGLLGSQLNRPGLTALAQAVPYFENMPFTDFTLRLNRNSDKRINIPELRFVGRNLLIDGTGNIAASSLKEAMNQPLDLTLQLGAKGKLVDYLETLSLLGPNTAEDGFRRWNNAIKIKGSLGDPDTSALQRILKEAANRALTESPRKKEEAVPEGETATEPKAVEATETPTEQNLQKKPSKEEKIIQDVEKGIELLDSLF